MSCLHSIVRCVGSTSIPFYCTDRQTFVCRRHQFLSKCEMNSNNVIKYIVNRFNRQNIRIYHLWFYVGFYSTVCVLVFILSIFFCLTICLICCCSWQCYDVTGGCGSMFEVYVVTPEFCGLRTVMQHRLVNEASWVVLCAVQRRFVSHTVKHCISYV